MAALLQPSSWPRSRRAQLGGSLGLLAALIGAGPALVAAWGAPSPPSAFAAALPALAWPALVVLAMTFAVMGCRFVQDVFDPIHDPETAAIHLSQRVLANSVEQMAIFVPAYLAFAASGGAAAAPRLAGLFALARLVFWAGYLSAPLRRSPGMAMTLALTILMLAWTVLRLA